MANLDRAGLLSPFEREEWRRTTLHRVEEISGEVAEWKREMESWGEWGRVGRWCGRVSGLWGGAVVWWRDEGSPGLKAGWRRVRAGLVAGWMTLRARGQLERRGELRWGEVRRGGSRRGGGSRQEGLDGFWREVLWRERARRRWGWETESESDLEMGVIR
jgi:hypothetical protein